MKAGPFVKIGPFRKGIATTEKIRLLRLFTGVVLGLVAV